MDRPECQAAGLRVLRLTPHIYRAGRWPVAFDPVGGLQRQVWKLSEALDVAGVTQTILTGHIPGSVRESRPWPGTVVIAVGPSLPERFADRLLTFSWFVGVAWWLLTRPHGDVVHIHFNHSLWCRVLAIGLRLCATPVVISLNTALGGVFDRIGSTKAGAGLADRLERAALAGAACVIALTARDAHRIHRQTGIDPARIAVVPDAVDASDWHGAPDPERVAAFRSDHRLPDDARIIAYVGRISAEKGWADLPLLLPSLAQAGLFLLVCGDGRDRARLESALVATGLANWRITGFVPPDEVRVALALATVLVLPSRREAFGSVLLEAMAAGVPAVAYAVGGIVEVSGPEAAVALVPPGDVARMASLTLALANDAQARGALRERGYRRVAEFGLAATVAKTLAIYESVRGKGSPGAVADTAGHP